MNTIDYKNYEEKKEHGSPLFPYNTYLCSIPLDFHEVPTHWHNEIEIIYVKKGSGTIYVDFKRYDVSAPAIFFIRPGQLHAILQFKNQTMEYENIIFHPKIFEEANSDAINQNYIWPILQGAYSVPVLFTPDRSDYELIAAPIDACDEICKTKPAGYEIFIKSQLFLLLYHFIDRYRNVCSDKKNQKKLDKIKPVLKYVENNYNGKITISEIAKTAGFSEAHFMRFFKETLGIPFVTYLNDYRLSMAARMLRGSDASILSISEEAGFQNLSHFNRAFKKKYEMSPSEYRRNHIGE